MIQHLHYIKDISVKLNEILTRRQKALAFLYLLLSVTNAVFQLLSVVIFAPLIGLILEPATADQYQIIAFVKSVFSVYNVRDLFLTICLIEIAIYIIKTATSILCIWYITKYARMVERSLSVEIMRRYLGYDYDFFLQYGAAHIQRDVQTDPIGVFGVINALFNIVNELFVILLVFLYIAFSDWTMAVCLLIVAGISLMVFYGLSRKTVQQQGIRMRSAAAEYNKVFLQTVGGIKEIHVMRKQVFFLRRFKNSAIAYHRPQVVGEVAGLFPSHAIEGIFMCGIIGFMYFRYLSDPFFAEKMSLFATFAMGAVRVIPSVGRISNYVNSMLYHIPAMNSLYENRNKNLQSEKPLSVLDENNAVNANHAVPRFDSLSIDHLYFHYEGKGDVLQDVSLFIRHGESVGIIGASGAGKSTLADIILGLHHPQAGDVLVNGTDLREMPDTWSRMVGYVPQSVYLTDGTIKENVAFGVEENCVDEALVIKSLQMAQLGEYVASLDDGIYTVIGERGVRISGGQQQRIAIARALYREPQVLVLDEATSALDTETETSLMRTVEGLFGEMTVIIIAHRLSTIMGCDSVYEILDGIVRKIDKAELENLK